MRLTKEQIDQIRIAFQKMQSREDLLAVLNIAKSYIYGEKVIPFKFNQLTYYSNPKLGGKRYSDFKIRKKSGSTRNIHSPVEGLKSLQSALNLILQCVFEPHSAAMGFVKDKSIVDNAKIHTGYLYVYNIDLKDFFPSIDQARVWKCLQLNPFLLNNAASLLEQKVCENPDIKFWQLPDHTSDKTINAKLWKLSFDGYRFPEGIFKMPLKDGGTIFYRINKAKNSGSQGDIIVFVDKSRFEQVRSVAAQSAIDDESDPEVTLRHIVWKLIERHQKKLFEKESRLKLANTLSAICCTEMEVRRKNENEEWISVKRNVLPQGAPTSPVITNIVCQRLDYLLSGVAKRYGLKYSRYADDITFSSKHNVYQAESEFLTELHRIIAEQGFHINESKTRLQKDGYRKEVTGLIVNVKANVQKRYVKQIRMWLYYWERYGYSRASSFFQKQYFIDKGHVKKGKPEMANVISGKLEYLKMVKGAEDSSYLILKKRFDHLVGSYQDLNKVSLNLDKVLSTLFTKGLDSAMELYSLLKNI